MSEQDHGTQALWPQMIAALAAIDDALGLPQDGCNSTARTLEAIQALKSGRASKRKPKESHKPWGLNDCLMATAAFRYCCGRRTYIVGACADWLIEQWPNIPDSTKGAIKRELEDEFKRDDEARARGDQYLPLGHGCDRRDWERVRSLWGEGQSADIKRALST